MSSPMVNGEVNGVPHSAFIDHLMRYPVVSDGVDTVKANKYGQQGIALSNSAYETLAKSVLPYLNKPYQYVSPYVKKADDMGDKTLSRLDDRFPFVQKPTGELYADGRSYVLFPYQKSVESRDHVMSVYSGERKKHGEGIVPTSKAVITTALAVTAETLSWVRDSLSKTTKTVQEKAN